MYHGEHRIHSFSSSSDNTQAGTEESFQNEQWVENTALPAVKNVKFHSYPHMGHQGTLLCAPAVLGYQPGNHLYSGAQPYPKKIIRRAKEGLPPHSSSLRNKEQHILLQEIVCGSENSLALVFPLDRLSVYF